MRSMATRKQNVSTSAMLSDAIAFLKSVGFDLIIVETAGIGQSDSEIVDLVDLALYVMTSEYGASSQLEKIDMLDYADMIVLNKFDKKGSEDAFRDIRKQWRRNRVEFEIEDEKVPVFKTIASQFNDPGVSWLFKKLCSLITEKLSYEEKVWLPKLDLDTIEPKATVLLPGKKVRYLSEIAENGRAVDSTIEYKCGRAAEAQHYYESLLGLEDTYLP